MSSRKTAGRRGTTKKRAQRATSNVFAMFNQDQIQEFKEAFNMIDQNRDGFIDKEDLHDMLASLGKDPTDEYLEAMMNEAPGAINFTMFLTLFGERLQGKIIISQISIRCVLYTPIDTTYTFIKTYRPMRFLLGHPGFEPTTSREL